MLTAQDIYTAARTLPLPERLRLAALILDELGYHPLPQTDLNNLPGYSDFWTEEDIQDFKHRSAHCFNSTEVLSDAEQDEALPPLEELLETRAGQNYKPKHI